MYRLMVDPVLVTVVLTFLGAPFLIGMYAVYWRTAGQPTETDVATMDRCAVYRRGFDVARVPILLVFVPLALASVYFQLFVLGYGGGPPPLPYLVGRVVGVVGVLAIYIGGLTIAGSTLGVYIHVRRTGTVV